MRNRMVMGAFRYGLLARHALDTYDLPREAFKRIEKYCYTQNLEYLVDAANMCMLEYTKASRQGKTLTSIDDGEHARPK